MTPLVPAGLVLLFSLGTYFSLSLPLSNSNVDTTFYQSSEGFNRFSDSGNKLPFSHTIENDTSRLRDFLLNGTFHLHWMSNTSSEEKSGNAFLLNILYPDYMDVDDPGRSSYIPKYYASGDELVFLLGTTYSFAEELFGKINDWRTEVNESSTSPSLLDKKTEKNKDHKLYLSHPQPIRGKNNRMIQDTAYKLEDNVSGKAIGMEKPFYYELEDGNVELVYAARDLKVNRKILNLSFNGAINGFLDSIHRSSVEEEDWISELSLPLTEKKYRMFVDFAVLKVKVKMIDLQNPFLAYLTKLYRKEERIPSIIKDRLTIVGGKTSPVFLGGWTTLSEEQREKKTMENLFVHTSIKENKEGELKNMLPNEITEKNFDEYLELKIYEKYSKMFRAGANSSPSEKYSIFRRELVPNDNSGILYVKFWLKNSKNKITSPEKKTVIYTGFKKLSENQVFNLGRDFNEKKQISDNKLVEFLESSPRAIASWRELEIKHTYFDSFNINKKLISSLALGEMDKTLGGEYLNLSHQLDVPNLNLETSEGMLAMMQDGGNEKYMLGMYEGTRHWNNFLYGDRSVGKIMMFVSPLRYDLFNHKNKLSRPSLADSLCKKGLGRKLIQVNRFFIDESDC